MGTLFPLSQPPWLTWRGRRGGVVCVEEGKLSYPFPLWIGQPGICLLPSGSILPFAFSSLQTSWYSVNRQRSGEKVESLKVWFPDERPCVRILSRNSILLQPSGRSPSHRFSSTNWSKRGKECVFQNNYPLAWRVLFCKVGKNYLIAEI